jgi:hypothetical protein
MNLICQCQDMSLFFFCKQDHESTVAETGCPRKEAGVEFGIRRTL